MTAREMEGLVVMLQEERGEVSQGVLFTKKSPHPILIIWVAMVELHGFQLRKLLYQRLLGVQWQIGSQHHRRPLKRLFQGSRHRTTARGEESVQE